MTPHKVASAHGGRDSVHYTQHNFGWQTSSVYAEIEKLHAQLEIEYGYSVNFHGTVFLDLESYTNTVHKLANMTRLVLQARSTSVKMIRV